MKTPSFDKKRIPAIVGIVIALIFSFWLMFHTFSYNSARGEIRIAFKLWSDFGAHIPLIRSFSMGGNWPVIMRQTPIVYPIYPGEPIRYHFLFDMGVGLLERMGIRIDWALNVPSALGLFGLMLSIYLLAKNLFKSSIVGVISVLFFLFNGSLGFLRFFETHPLSAKTFLDIFKARDFPAFAPWGPGDVSAFWNLNVYTNQRHLAIAFALIIAFILSVLRIEKHPFKKQLPWALVWGMIFGFLPYFHQPALLIVAVIMVCYFCFFGRLRIFLLITGGIAALLVVPQLLAAHGSVPSIALHAGYIIHNEIENLTFPHNVLRLATFWWHNLGAHIVLMPLGFLLIPKRARMILFPILPLFIIANLFKFSVEISANHKFFNFVMILGQMISAYVIVWFAQLHVKHLPHIARATVSIGRVVVLVGLIGMLTLSGIIDFCVVANDTKGSLADIPTNEVATWIAKNTPPDAVFLNSSYLYHPASVAGRSIFLGWPYFAWSAGYLGNRFERLHKAYEAKDPNMLCPLLKENGIDYITVEDTKGDINLPVIDVSYFFSNFQPVYTNATKTYGIFATAQLCTAK